MKKTTIGVAFVIAAACGPVSAQEHYYATNGSDPWGQTTNDGAMDMVFGAGGWIKGNYNTWNAKDIFDDGTECVYLEGGDSLAGDLNSFISANHALIENWVADGHGLFINAAPNVGGNQNWGFGGVTLNYPGPGTQIDHLDAIDPSHPIWNGPFTPAGTSFDGTGTHHAWITGGGVTNLAKDNNGNFPLAELKWGAGLVLFGGMTTDGWWTTQPGGHNVRANMIEYMCRVPSPGAPTLLAVGGLVAGRRRR
jgi:hypothetical protein